MTILIEPLIDEVRDNLASITYEMIDDNTIKTALKDSYGYIQMVVDEAMQKESSVKNCLVRLATHKSYLYYTMFAETKDGTIPESSALILSNLHMMAYACLSLIASVPLNEDFSLKEDNYPTPIGASLTTSSCL